MVGRIGRVTGDDGREIVMSSDKIQKEVKTLRNDRIDPWAACCLCVGTGAIVGGWVVYFGCIQREVRFNGLPLDRP